MLSSVQGHGVESEVVTAVKIPELSGVGGGDKRVEILMTHGERKKGNAVGGTTPQKQSVRKRE